MIAPPLRACRCSKCRALPKAERDGPVEVTPVQVSVVRLPTGEAGVMLAIEGPTPFYAAMPPASALTMGRKLSEKGHLAAETIFDDESAD